MTSKESIINNLRELADKPINHSLIEEIAYFIIADRKRIVEPLVKHRIDNPMIGDWRKAIEAIDETLRLAGVEE